jgi:peptidyl-dipeptidase Dcp
MKENITTDDIHIRTDLKAGDIGYITWLHGVLYKEEFNYSIYFESYVAKGLSEFYEQYDPAKDRVWICEHDNRIIGFLLLMHKENATAQLRFFILESHYRGIGLGKKLMKLLKDFLHEKNYKHCYLWTTNEQRTAIQLYKKAGFILTEEKQSDVFGKTLTEQRYDLKIAK